MKPTGRIWGKHCRERKYQAQVPREGLSLGVWGIERRPTIRAVKRVKQVITDEGVEEQRPDKEGLIGHEEEYTL